ncbi:hypothetical protein D3C77_470630 [compost metagenome]
MKTFKLDDMTRGWFVGAFNPTSFATEACEVGLKRYAAGDYEASHYHKVATEITLIVEGRVLMNGIEYSTGDIIIIEPGDMTDFRALTDAVNVVIKTPGALHDKYIP